MSSSARKTQQMKMKSAATEATNKTSTQPRLAFMQYIGKTNNEFYSVPIDFSS